VTEVLTLLGTALLFLLCALLGSLWGFTLAWGPQALREASEISRRGRKIRSRHRSTDAERDGLIHERRGRGILRTSSLRRSLKFAAKLVAPLRAGRSALVLRSLP
jgi:hypothetical protein